MASSIEQENVLAALARAAEAQDKREELRIPNFGSAESVERIAVDEESQAAEAERVKARKAWHAAQRRDAV